VILDAGPLSLVAKPVGRDDAAPIQRWVKGLVAGGTDVAVPEIARYEVRRELFRSGSTGGISRLDHLHPALDFLPITSLIIDIASELWAQVRARGLQTDDDQRLDGDVILAATALVAAETVEKVVIATNNVGHIARFPGVEAREWWTIV
jgi:predicted nucleic acid-binding protein